MIEKTLKSVFDVVVAEAASNRVFGRKLEDKIISLAKDLEKARELEQQVAEFSPFVTFKEDGAEALDNALKNKSLAALKKIIQRHNIDPANNLSGRPTRARLIAAIIEGAEKRAKRDAKLFDY